MSKASERELSEVVAAEVSPELKRRIRIAAAREDKSIAQFMREHLDEITKGVE